MSTTLLLAISINIGLLLIASWGFGIYIIKSINKDKQRLADELEELRNQQAMFPDNVAIAHTFIEKEPVDNIPVNDEPAFDASLLDEMALEIQEKEARIRQLLKIKDNQQSAQQSLRASDPNAEMLEYLEQLEADFNETAKIIIDLQNDLDKSRHAMNRMEEEIAAGHTQSARVFALEDAQYKMRNENKQLRTTGQKLAEKLELRNNQINHLKNNNAKLKKSIASLTNASKEQLAIINKLHAQVERAEQLESHQRKLIIDLEARLNVEKGLDNDLEKVHVMEAELEDLKDKLQRTLIEKEFIEEHMLELDDSLEKAKETEEALARAQQEIASLEKHYPEFKPTTTESSAIAVQPFSTDIPELNNILDNHRLFGSVQEFWTTLDLPPVMQIEKNPIPIPELDNWVHIIIGQNDYSVFLTVEPELIDIVTAAIFKGDDGERNSQDTTGEFCNIIAGTLATELDNNFSLSVPRHLNHEESQTLIASNNIVSEVLLVAKQKPLYAVLTTPKTEQT